MLQKTSRQGKARFGLCLSLSFPKKENAALAREAVLPDLNAKHAKRSTVSIGIKNRIISINIRANDAVAMRASLNGCLNSIILAKNLTEV